MSLSDAELARIKAELGFNLLTVSAEPFIGVSALFENIIQRYLGAGAATTSSTTVAAAAVPTPIAVTLASASGFATGARVWVDVDARLESATVQSLTGAVATMLLQLEHAGTYQVSVDGGESIVRECLARIKATKDQMATVFGTGALKKVDEIEWYGSTTKTQFGILGDQLMYWRDELASILGAPNMWRQKRSAGSTVAMY